MKKTYIITFILVVILVYMAVPIPITNAKIRKEENAMHAFITYEQNFSALNQKNLSLKQHAINKQEDDRYQIQDLSRSILLLNFNRSSYVLNKTVQHLQKQYPFLSNAVKQFDAWKSRSERQLLSGKHLLYWQGPLLSYQLRMMALINNKYSGQNWAVEKQMKREKKIVSKLSVAQQCQILSQFGQTQSPKVLSEQLAILSNHTPKC